MMTSEPIEIMIAGLSGFRMAIFIVQEDGPFGFMERIRSRLGAPKVGQMKARPGIDGIITCVACCSVWTSALAYGLCRTGAVEVVAPVAAMGAALALVRLRG